MEKWKEENKCLTCKWLIKTKNSCELNYEAEYKYITRNGIVACSEYRSTQIKGE